MYSVQLLGLFWVPKRRTLPNFWWGRCLPVFSTTFAGSRHSVRPLARCLDCLPCKALARPYRYGWVWWNQQTQQVFSEKRSPNGDHHYFRDIFLTVSDFEGIRLFWCGKPEPKTRGSWLNLYRWDVWKGWLNMRYLSLESKMTQKWKNPRNKKQIQHVASGIRKFMRGEDYTVNLLQKRKRGVL